MKKILFILIAGLLFLSTNNTVLASRTEFSTDQVCNIKGTIASVDSLEAFRDPCLDSGSCPVGAYSPEQPARYELGILVNTVSCKPWRAFDTLESQFPLNKEAKVRIDKIQVRNGDSFEVGKKISGQVEYILGFRFISYELEKRVNENTNNQSSIIDYEQQKLNIFLALFLGILFATIVVFFIKKRK